jgi:hypothetical protein
VGEWRHTGKTGIPASQHILQNLLIQDNFGDLGQLTTCISKHKKQLNINNSDKQQTWKLKSAKCK